MLAKSNSWSKSYKSSTTITYFWNVEGHEENYSIDGGLQQNSHFRKKDCKSYPTNWKCFIYYWEFFTPIQILLENLISSEVKQNVLVMKFALASPPRSVIGIKRTIHICLVWNRHKWTVIDHIEDFPLAMMR